MPSVLLPATSKAPVNVWIQVTSHQSLGKTSGNNSLRVRANFSIAESSENGNSLTNSKSFGEVVRF